MDGLQCLEKISFPMKLVANTSAFKFRKLLEERRKLKSK